MKSFQIDELKKIIQNHNQFLEKIDSINASVSLPITSSNLTTPSNLSTSSNLSTPMDLLDAVEHVIKLLDTGELTVVRLNPEHPHGWETLVWVKSAILWYFKLKKNDIVEGQATKFFDKIPLKFANYQAADFIEQQIRVVPAAYVRRGAYIAPRVVLMPSYVNIGAHVGEGSMIDTWATIGSCARIGKNVHISGGVGIGGVLEPLQQLPTIIEDNCFIGARSEIVEGVIVKQNSVIAMGTYIGQSTKIYNRMTDEIISGYVPEGSVVVPGSMPASNGRYNINCAIIVKQVDAKTRSKVAINELLRIND